MRTGQVAEVQLAFKPVGGTGQNVSMMSRTLPSGDRVWEYSIPAQSSPGPVTYRIYAKDSNGNAVVTQVCSVEIRAPAGAPESGVESLVPLLILIVVAALVVLGALRLTEEAIRAAPHAATAAANVTRTVQRPFPSRNRVESRVFVS